MPSKLTVVLLSLLLAAPALIFWLWLVILPARVPVQCPEECKCDTEGYQVTCDNTSVTVVPSILFSGVRELTITNNKITMLERGCFVLSGLTELEVLSVERCGLRAIELGAFRGLTKLTKLSVKDNELSEIMSGTFKNMINLEELRLNRNRLEHISSDVFSGLVNLRYVDFKQNKLQYLHPDTFLGLPKFESLELSFNPGLQIPTDRSFIKSHSLSLLVISVCKVNSVSAETFTNVSVLKWLMLGGNNLRTVDINILRVLPKLSKMFLYGNPLHCDCKLQEVWRLFKDRGIEAGFWNKWPTCDTPREVKGMGWWRVFEERQCVQGNIQYHGDYNNTRYNYTNTTGSYSYKYNVEILKKHQLPVYAVLFMFGTTSNVILLIIITCNKDMRTVPNIYIINLAISDIIYLTVHFSEAFANGISDMWLQGDFMCMFLPFCRRLSVGLSAYSVAVLSTQRYRVTVNPLHVRLSSRPTWRDIVATICGVWIVAALFAVPSAVSKYLCEGFQVLELRSYYKLVVIFELLVSCVIPLCVIAFTYTMTALHLVESCQSISEGTQNPQLNTRRNTAKILVGLTVVFMVSYVPYHVLWTYVVHTVKEKTYIEEITEILSSNYELQYAYLISTYFLLINSCLNPVALFCTSSLFRHHLKRYVTCCCKTNSPPDDIKLTRRN